MASFITLPRSLGPVAPSSAMTAGYFGVHFCRAQLRWQKREEDTKFLLFLFGKFGTAGLGVLGHGLPTLLCLRVNVACSSASVSGV